MSVVIRLYTDFVCPFCFIAEQSTVPRLLADFDVTLDWRGFELHPRTPHGGMPLAQLFPGADLSAMHERTQRFGAQFGVKDFSPPVRIQNSRRALAMAEFARTQDKLEPFRAAAFEAHWRQGKNLEDDNDLRALAIASGLDPEDALGAADDPAYLGRVDDKQALARTDGVSGVPTFVIGHQKIVGCQPYEVLADAARRAGAVPRTAL
jgi:predicted DsbA family dithiol-disulfide isomerase